MLLPNAVVKATGAPAWRPFRDLSLDWSGWGRYEAWQGHHVVDGRVVPTGDWLIWDSVSGKDCAISRAFVQGGTSKSREVVETIAVLWNEGKGKTRVVTPCFSMPSCKSFDELYAKWGHLEREFYGEA